MRITLNMLTGKIQDNLTASAEKLVDAQDRASSGKRLHVPSDDVTGTSQAMRLRSSISEVNQFERQSGVLESQLTMTSSTLDSVVTSLQQVRSLALQGAVSTTSNEARTALAAQLDQIMNAIAAQANTQHAGKYIFAGGRTNAPSIVANGGGTPPFIYQGDQAQFSIQVSPGTYITGNVTGDKLFNMTGAAVPTSPDVFSTIQSLKQEILSGDVQAISQRLNDIDANLNNVISIRSQVGGRLTRLETINSSLLDSKQSLMNLLSQTEDADLSEAVMDLQMRQNVYQAAIAVASKVLNQSLADYIK